ncbi:FKBP-type peptidyl-prolyl cis-trans isomerase [Apibacter sp. HY039]|uniref:FKBP-type peptidyl-prolyl cis-trans isomerase n=1 Tax=Apibacter sp. HY039 TaxID=2501476 RepID=UPI000FEBE35D|nr:FKBP-type peptidyl-prolyl cis-trans isomerase [Apibacter sp. HY039]
MKKYIVMLSFLISVLNYGQKISKLKTDDEKASYALGVKLAAEFIPKGLDKDINLNILIRAMRDKFNNKKLLFSEDSIQSFMANYLPEHLKKIGEINAENSKKFLELNKNRSGIYSTDSGLQYKILKEGTGPQPTEKDIVSVHYVLKTKEGIIIDNSKKSASDKPVDYPFSQTILGWQEGIKLMNKGSKYILYIPPELAYGENGPLGPYQVLVFEVELVEIKSEI